MTHYLIRTLDADGGHKDAWRCDTLEEIAGLIDEITTRRQLGESDELCEFVPCPGCGEPHRADVKFEHAKVVGGQWQGFSEADYRELEAAVKRRGMVAIER